MKFIRPDFAGSRPTLFSVCTFFVFVTLFFPLGLYAQDFGWAKQYGSPAGYWEQTHSLVVDHEGSVYTTGMFRDSADFDPGPATVKLYGKGGRDLYVESLDSLGNFKWAQAIGGINAYCEGYSITVDLQKNLYITGYFEGIVDFDPGPGIYNVNATSLGSMFILKLDSLGRLRWAKPLRSNVITGGYSNVVTDNQGYLYIAGSFHENVALNPATPNVWTFTSQGNEDVFLLKMDTAGQYVYARRMGGVGSDVAMDLALDAQNNVYITGGFMGTSDFNPAPGMGNANVYNLTSEYYRNAFVCKLNSAGIFQWARHIPCSNYSCGWVIDVDHAGNPLIAINFKGTTDLDPGTATVNVSSTGTYSAIIEKLDVAGNYVWGKRLNSTVEMWGHDIAVDFQNSVYLTGYFEGTSDLNPGPGVYSQTTPANTTNTYVEKLDSAGNFKFAKTWVSTTGSAMDTYAYGDVYIAGILGRTTNFNPGGPNGTLSVPNLGNLFVVKLDGDPCLPYESSSTTTLTSCGPYTLNGQTYTVSGSYQQALDNALGCDSTVTLNLTVYPVYQPQLTQTVCQSYTLNGQTYTVSGTYTQPYTSVHGCDSNLTLHLTVNQPGVSILTDTTCGAYTLNGQTYTSSGTYTQTLPGVGGCDSTITLQLMVLPISSTQLVQTACGSYTLNGQTYTASGTYTQIHNSAIDCDSIVSLQLTVLQPSFSQLSQTACGSYTYNGQTYTGSGTYTHVFTNTVGCDSNVVLHLTVLQPSASQITQTACNSISINGQTYTASGTYTQLYTNTEGCDSIVTLYLTIQAAGNLVLTETACGSYTLNWQTYTASGTYTQTFVTPNGCDSTVTLHLTLLPAVPVTQLSQTACDSFTYNGQTYTNGGVYTHILNTATGCDSTVILSLTVLPLPNMAVLQSGFLLAATPSPGAAYQWINCATQQPVPGAVNANYTPGTNGTYAVQVTQNGCTDTSACYTIAGMGISENGPETQIQLYPNPAQEQITLLILGTWQNSTLRVITLTGQAVHAQPLFSQQTVLDISTYAAGVYFMELTQNGEVYRMKWVKW